MKQTFFPKTKIVLIIGIIITLLLGYVNEAFFILCCLLVFALFILLVLPALNYANMARFQYLKEYDQKKQSKPE